MISVVVCHRNNKLLDQFKNSLITTIGVPFEFVIIDNTSNKYSIFQAYNLGVKLSLFDIICFSHEDIVFHTNDWGVKVIEHFKDSKVGIIGVAGSHYMPKMPGGYWSTRICSFILIQNNTRVYQNYTKIESISLNAVVVDGLWFCVPKRVFKDVLFDETLFSGFHCYDSDICLQILKHHFSVKVVFNILVEHFTSGNQYKIWLLEIFKFYEKWKNELPKNSIELTKKEKSLANYLNARELIELMRTHNFVPLKTITIWKLYLHSNPLNSLRNLKYLLILIKRLYLPEPFRSKRILNISL